MKLILASSNKGKIKELKELLKDLPIDVYSLGDLNFTEEIEETGMTFEENAMIKAKTISERYPDYLCLADDSGLCVEALNGEPGIHSHRYSKEETDPENRKKLLKNLQNIKNRDAYFACSMVLIMPNYKIVSKTGICKGTIALDEKGTNGFGYDAIFIPEGSSRHLAEYTDSEKNAISHRGKALREIVKVLYENINRF